MDCQLVEDRPVAAPETALGRCRASVAVEDALRACERQHGDVPTPLTERIRQVLREASCDPRVPDIARRT